MQNPRLSHVLSISILRLRFILEALHVHRLRPDLVAGAFDVMAEAREGVTYGTAKCVGGDP